MGIYNALYAGASGLTASGEGMRVIGDNIANINTTGFKSQNVNFSDILGQTLSTTGANIANQVGNGVQIASIAHNQAQGSLKSTSSTTDMAINGAGMFSLRDPVSGATQYTRAGSFQLDAQSNLINPQGLIVQGWAVDAAGNLTGNPIDISTANATTTAQATTQVNAGLTVNSTVTPINPAITPFDPANAATYHFKSAATVYDSLGAIHNLNLYFVKIGNNAAGNAVWDWHATVDGAQVTGGTAGIATEINPAGVGTSTPSTVAGNGIVTAGSQSLTFSNTNGTLITEIAPNLTFPWLGSTASSLAFNFGNATTTDAQGILGTGNNGVTQLAGASSTRFMNTDGFAAGTLDHLETDTQGRISGVFSNGQRRALFQVALAKFPNEAVLNKLGGNMFAPSIASGNPVMATAGTSGLGSISPSALEQSNVDLGAEFVKLIITQRAYQASSKTIQTTDQMLNSLMTLKR